VALPLEWKELDSLKSGSQFLMKDVLKRIKGKRPKLSTSGLQQTLPRN
jgi:DNA primase